MTQFGQKSIIAYRLSKSFYIIYIESQSVTSNWQDATRAGVGLAGHAVQKPVHYPAGCPRIAAFVLAERASLRRIGSGSALTVLGPISDNFEQLGATLSVVIACHRRWLRRPRINIR